MVEITTVDTLVCANLREKSEWMWAELAGCRWEISDLKNANGRLVAAYDGLKKRLDEATARADANQAAADTLAVLRNGEFYHGERLVGVEHYHTLTQSADTLERLRNGEQVEIDGKKQWFASFEVWRRVTSERDALAAENAQLKESADTLDELLAYEPIARHPGASPEVLIDRDERDKLQAAAETLARLRTGAQADVHGVAMWLTTVPPDAERDALAAKVAELEQRLNEVVRDATRWRKYVEYLGADCLRTHWTSLMDSWIAAKKATPSCGNCGV